MFVARDDAQHQAGGWTLAGDGGECIFSQHAAVDFLAQYIGCVAPAFKNRSRLMSALDLTQASVHDDAGWNPAQCMMAFRIMMRKAFAVGMFTALEAVRGRLLWLFLVVILAAQLIAGIAGTAAVTERNAITVGMLAAVLRLAAVLLTALFVVNSVAREQAEKASELVLALAIPRYVYYFGKLVGCILVAMSIAMLCSLPLLPHAAFNQVLLWGMSLSCELALVAALSLVLMFTFSQIPVALTAAAGFYLLARIMDAIRLMAHGPLVDTQALSSRIIARAVDVLAYLLPPLSDFTSSDWLIYGDGGLADMKGIVAQTIVYLAMLAGAGLFDLYRRNF